MTLPVSSPTQEGRQFLQVPTPQPAEQGTPQPDRPLLDVTDALRYLNKVKVQFEERPDVYNHFLDTMTDYKNQRCVSNCPSYLHSCSHKNRIDTPGVIERVATLFRGHPSLVQGFNTFVPPDRRVDDDTHAHPNPTAATPSGTRPLARL